VAVEREFESDAARAATDLENWPIGPAGEGEPETDVIGKGGMDGVVEVRINSVGVWHAAIVDCGLAIVDSTPGGNARNCYLDRCWRDMARPKLEM